jgi:indolepyruvate ferredoxin oxidoreductase beta subunit
MENSDFNLLIVGVGGQGVISTIQILAWTALEEKYNVRTAETHGMAQRGGSVASFLRFGSTVEGPLIPRGKVQVILAFEASESVRYFSYADSKTLFLINDKIIIPPTVNLMGIDYPNKEEILKFLNQVTTNIFFINGTEETLKIGNPRALNVFMLGVLSGSQRLPLKRENLIEAIMRFVPKKSQQVNKLAFENGINLGKSLLRGSK